MDLKQSIGIKLKSARRKAGLTQEELAERIDRSPEAVSNVERGLSLPTLETLERMARAVGVPLGFFFDEGTKRSTPRRAELEARCRLLLDGLSERDLETALGLLEVLEHSAVQTRGRKSR